MNTLKKISRILYLFFITIDWHYVKIYYIILNTILTVTYFLKIDDFDDIIRTNLYGVGFVLFYMILKNYKLIEGRYRATIVDHID